MFSLITWKNLTVVIFRSMKAAYEYTRFSENLLHNIEIK